MTPTGEIGPVGSVALRVQAAQAVKLRLVVIWKQMIPAENQSDPPVPSQVSPVQSEPKALDALTDPSPTNPLRPEPGHGNSITALCPISRTELCHVGRVFQVVSQRRFEFPRAMAMNDAQKRRAGQRRTIQCRNHVIQCLVRRLPSNIHDRLFIEPQPAAR
jgi:hypothetical protein